MGKLQGKKVRLVFGSKASQDLFDDIMQEIIGDIPRCLNQRDDLLLEARCWEGHNETLEAVLKRASDFRITINREKCMLLMSELEFYVYKFTKKGLKPTGKKVDAVKSRGPRTSIQDGSFLDMTGYLSKFIPRYASLTKSLLDLTLKDVKFNWGEKEEAAFAQSKEVITSKVFNPKLPIMVRTEASYNEGFSAGLFLKSEKGWQPGAGCIKLFITF